MDTLSVPYKVTTTIDTYEGDWTAEEIDAGLAGEPRKEITSCWYENTASGPQPVTDIKRIEQLEATI